MNEPQMPSVYRPLKGVLTCVIYKFHLAKLVQLNV